ncbi:SLATT domain-containing protein [Streptomyces tricolor]
MNVLRARSFADRKNAYLRDRIEDQQRWYAIKASWNVARARRWRLLLVAVEGLGLAAAVLRLTGTLTFDLAGVLGAVLGAGAAWFAVRQYETLGRAYTFAATELSMAVSGGRGLLGAGGGRRGGSDQPGTHDVEGFSRRRMTKTRPYGTVIFRTMQLDRAGHLGA